MRFLRAPRPTVSSEPRRWSRARRWVARFLVGAAGLVVLGVVTIVVLLHSLERPWIKRRVQAAAAASGVAIDYRTARVDLLSGAHVEDLVVRSPPEMRAIAPDLARVGRLNARWSPGRLFGAGSFVERVAIEDASLTIVEDESGRTSFDALSPAKTSSNEARTPLSARPAKALAGVAPVGRIDVDRLAVARIETVKGVVAGRTDVRGIDLTAVTSPDAAGWKVRAELGAPDAPLDLIVSRMHDATSASAKAKAWVTLEASKTDARIALDLRMVEQSFAAGASLDHRLHAEASARFDPSAGRVVVEIDPSAAEDGAATVEASIELPDEGWPRVRRARGDVDLARMLAWLPPGLSPVTAARAHLRYQVDALDAGAVPRLADAGSAGIDAELADVGIETSRGTVHVASGALSLHARPAPGGGLAMSGTLELTDLRVAHGDAPIAIDEAKIDLDGRRDGAGGVTGNAAVRFGRFDRGGPSPIAARDGRVTLAVADLRPDPAAPLATRGDVAASLAIGSIDARGPGSSRVSMDQLALHAHTRLEGHAPYAIEVDAPIARVRFFQAQTRKADTPAHLTAKLRDVRPDLATPTASLAVVHATLALGDAEATLDATKERNALDFVLRAHARSLATVKPLLPASLAGEAPWDRMGVSLRTSGRVAPLAGSPTLRETTELTIDQPGYEGIAADSATLSLKSAGDVLRHEVDLDVRAKGLTIDGANASDDRLILSASVDRPRRSLRVDVATEGRANVKVVASASFDPSRRALPYDVEAHLGGLAPLAPFAARVKGLAGLDLSQLDVALSAHGSLLGVLAGVGANGAFALEPDPLRTIAIEGKTELRVAHLRWTKGDAAIVAPSLAWLGDTRVEEGRRVLESHLTVGTLHVDAGTHDVDLNGIRDDATASVVGSLANPDVSLTQRLGIHGVTQDFAPEYPMGDLDVSLTAERGPEGIVHIDALKVANGAGGTGLDATGNVNLGDGRRSLSITTSLTQSLGSISTIPARFKGTGKVAIDANVMSTDLAHYQVRAAVKGEDVTVTLPHAGIEVDAANGEVPVTLSLVLGAKGLALQRSEKQSPYSMLRFADQHPLLTRSGFLSVARIKTPYVSIAPLVGNLMIEENLIALQQFEMGVRGGRITGLCGVDWNGPRSTVELHVRANGVQSSHGEPFDGNVAVVISAADRTVEGRAEILRIGERHLLDLLDLQDPMHVDPAMNRVRSALVYGYPESLRLVFDHGFANAHLELGGLAKLVSISELRGIPMGRIVDKLLAPMLDGPEAKEEP